MSDNIPFDIQSEIISRLPVKPLIQFRSVSKAWKSLIDSSEFIANYHVRNAQPQHRLLVSHALTDNCYEIKYVSIADDDTFPQRTFPLTVPVSIQQLIEPTMVTSQGLVCFCGGASVPDDTDNEEAVIWNPAIRKSVSVVVPNNVDTSYETVVGFGVCPNTCDPKLVKVAFHRNSDSSQTIVEVFSLGIRAWRRLTVNLPRTSIAFTENNVAIDRFIYWYACDVAHWYDLIVSFDMMTEEFTEIGLPDSLACLENLFISKLGESLAVVHIKREVGKVFFSVWEMEDGVTKLFKKLFTIKIPDEFRNKSVLGFRKSGEAITEMGNDFKEDSLFVYKTNSEKSTPIGITGYSYTFRVRSYMETLFLLDH